MTTTLVAVPLTTATTPADTRRPTATTPVDATTTTVVPPLVHTIELRDLSPTSPRPTPPRFLPTLNSWLPSPPRFRRQTSSEPLYPLLNSKCISWDTFFCTVNLQRIPHPYIFHLHLFDHKHGPHLLELSGREVAQVATGPDRSLRARRS